MAIPPVGGAPVVPEDQVEIEKKQETEYLGHVVNTAKYSGVAALCVALLSMFCLTGEEGTGQKKIGNYLGNCYLILECILIVAVVAVVGLKIFQKASI